MRTRGSGRPRAVRPAVLLAALALLTACTGPTGPGSAPPDGDAPPTGTASDGAGPRAAEPRTVATDLDVPWSVAFVAGTPLISERDSGRILELAADGSVREIGTVPGVRHGGEGGLLGLAVDGEQRLYVYSTGRDGNRVQRFALDGPAGAYTLGSAETLLDGIPSGSNHNGGRLALGPDGMLYVATGDAGERRAAQDPASLAGKILRLTPDGDVPEDNPTAGSPVFSTGHRNVQGMAWSADGAMYATEFGQNTWDELNLIVAGGNYGWPEFEGAAGRDPFRDPVQQWRPSDASPSGLAIVEGTLVVANLRGEVLRTAPVADPTASTDRYAGELGRLRDVVPGPAGGVWVLTSNTDGRGTPRPGDDRILEVPLPR
jgi:glucose/arabinose dehydrogenase